MAVRAFITGLSGTTLTAAERAFLREREPWGFIIFARNVETPSQLSRLLASVRDAVRRDAPVLVDQEGGRVQRLGPPHWPSYPPGAAYGRLYDSDAAQGTKAAYLGARLIAADLAAVGIDVDCLPVADVPVSGADSVIGDRASSYPCACSAASFEPSSYASCGVPMTVGKSSFMASNNIWKNPPASGNSSRP